jgi:transposase-like protein
MSRVLPDALAITVQRGATAGYFWRKKQVGNMEAVGKCATRMEKGIFLPSDVVKDFDATWLDETLCRSWVMLRLHHDGAGCPSCGKGLTEVQRLSFFEQKRVRCSGCGKYYSATTGTFICRTKLDFRQLVLLYFLVGVGVDDARIASALCVDKTTVWKYRKQIEGMHA